MSEPIQADKVKAKNVEWIWPLDDGLDGRIPREMLTIVGGRPDQRKGLAVTRIAADVSNSQFPIKPRSKTMRSGRVLYSAMEDSYALMTRPRLDAVGANLESIDLWRFRLPLHFEELAHRLVNDGPYDLLIMDPFASHLSTGVSRHSDNVRTVTDPLIHMLEQTGAACIIVEHVLKRVPQSGHPIAAIGGTGSGLIAAARMGFLFGTDPDDIDRSYLACVKHNICPKPPEMAFELETRAVKGVRVEQPLLNFDEECEFDPMLFLQPKKKGKMGRNAEKRAMACEWLAEYLYAASRQGLPAVGTFEAVPPGPVPARRVLEDGLQFKLSEKTLRRAAGPDDLNVIKEPSSGPNTKWGLQPAMIAEMDEGYGISQDAPADEELEASHANGNGNGLREDAAAAVKDATNGEHPLPSERKSMIDMSEFEKAAEDV